MVQNMYFWEEWPEVISFRKVVSSWKQQLKIINKVLGLLHEATFFSLLSKASRLFEDLKLMDLTSLVITKLFFSHDSTDVTYHLFHPQFCISANHRDRVKGTRCRRYQISGLERPVLAKPLKSHLPRCGYPSVGEGRRAWGGCNCGLYSWWGSLVLFQIW